MNKENREFLEKLLHTPAVEKRMKDQWDSLPEIRPETETGERIHKKIQRRIGTTNDSSSRPTLYKIAAAAASVLLVLSMEAMLFQAKNPTTRTMYIVSSGIRSIETIVLPDGTQVQMGPNSRLTYPAHFTDETRDVELMGQAFFNVTENKEKPFIVHTDRMNVTALGTSFEVFNYTDENKLETILKEGKVRVDLKNPHTGQKREIFLDPNNMLVYNKQNNLCKVRSVNAQSYTAWSRQGILSFENERLEMILSRLEPWYGRKVKCSPEVAGNYRFTFKVRDESLERILFMMSNSSPLNYKETEEGCYEIYLK